MEIITIFEGNLYAVKYADEQPDELECIFVEWSDVQILFDFFDEHEQDLAYFNLTKEIAVKETICEAKQFRKELLKCKDSPEMAIGLFEKLSYNNAYELLLKQKSKRKWLRIYAIRIEENCFLITGGAIKLTQTMNERKHTNDELVKLERVRNYLTDNNVFDFDSFNDMQSEL